MNVKFPKVAYRTVLILLLTLCLTVTIYGQDTETEWCLSVWYPSSEHPGGGESLLTHADLIDEVNAFWYMPAPDGGVIAVNGAEDTGRAAEQVASWREAGLTVIPSVFASISDVIGDELRDTHIAALVDVVVSNDYDGIDIDYEGFPAETREDFSLFIEGLAEALHAEGRLLSVTVHAKTTDEGAWDGARAQDWARLSAVADMFRLMTYDYTNRNESPGPIAPTPWVLEVLAYAETVVADMSKVHLGLHFYGYSWQRGTPPATTVAYASISNWIENLGAQIYRDPNGDEAFVDFKIQGLPRQVVYFADPQGLESKLTAVAEAYPQIGGVAVWGIGGEHPGLWDVLAPYLGEGNCQQGSSE